MSKKTYTKKEEMLNVNAIMFKCKDCFSVIIRPAVVKAAGRSFFCYEEYVQCYDFCYIERFLLVIVSLLIVCKEGKW